MHLAFADIGVAWAKTGNWADFWTIVRDLPFYSAPLFTLTYTAVVTQLFILVGLAIAMEVNALPKLFKGPSIFVSLLQFLVTPLVGSLILFWMVDSDGVIAATIQRAFNDPNLSLKASASLTWTMLMVCGVWHTLPFRPCPKMSWKLPGPASGKVPCIWSSHT